MRVRGLLPIEQESTRQRVERLNREIDELLESVAKTGEISKRKAEEIHGIRQEIVQKTGSVLGSAGRFAGKAIRGETLGGKLADGITKGAAGLVGEAAKKAGRVLEGTAGVEEAQRRMTEEFDAFQAEVNEAIEGVREDGHIVEKIREKGITSSSEVVVDLSVGGDGKVYVRG